MNLKALTAVTFALSMALYTPAQNPCLAQGAEPAAAGTNAAKAEGKVLVVLVYDQNCKVWCTHVRPIIRQLAEEFGERVHVEEIDNSPSTAKTALSQVKELGILKWYEDVESVPVVLLFDAKRKQCKEINGPKEKDIYKAAIEKVIAKG